MLEVFAIADDLTGALEVGALLAESGMSSVVTTRASICRDHINGCHTARVVDLETRHLSEEEASKRLRGLVSQVRQLGVETLYKKTDSTLRGPVGAELNAFMQAWPERALVFVPAYPQLGRVVREGMLFIDEEPLEKTRNKYSPLESFVNGSIRDVIQPNIAVPVVSVANSDVLSRKLREAEKVCLYVCDGETERDLHDTVQCLVSQKVLPLLAGPAGCVRPLAKALSLPYKKPLAHPGAATGLTVNGSLNGVSREQTQQAKLNGIPLVVMDLDPACDDKVLNELVVLSREHSWLTLESAGTLAPYASGTTLPVTISQRLARIAISFLKLRQQEVLVVFGGDTSYAVFKELGISNIDSIGELLPGVPISKYQHNLLDCYLLTKAGNFGTRNAISEIRSNLRQKSRSSL